jgi:hypothetical protein
MASTKPGTLSLKRDPKHANVESTAGCGKSAFAMRIEVAGRFNRDKPWLWRNKIS